MNTSADRLFPVLRALALLALTAASGACLRAQSFTFAEFRSLSREFPSLGSQGLASLAGRAPQGFLQSDAFQALKAKASATPLTEFPQSLRPVSASAGREATRALTANLVQVGTPTAVPELPDYAALMGCATLAYVMFRRRGMIPAPIAAS